MKNIIVVLCSLVCFNGFSMEERFKNFETQGIQLTIVNATDALITAKCNSDSLILFDRSYNIPSNEVAADGELVVEIAFRKDTSDRTKIDDAIEIHQGEDFVSLKTLQTPSPSIAHKSNKGLLYKLYSAKKGGGAEYYLVVAKDILSLSLYKPRNSTAQSYSEVDSSDSDSE